MPCPCCRKKGKIENEKKGPGKIISIEEEILSFIFKDIFVSGVKYRTVGSGGKILSAFNYIPSSSEFFRFLVDPMKKRKR